MTEPVCHEYLGPDRGECGKPATHEITGPLVRNHRIYKCQRHASLFVRRNPNLMADDEYAVKELTRVS